MTYSWNSKQTRWGKRQYLRTVKTLWPDCEVSKWLGHAGKDYQRSLEPNDVSGLQGERDSERATDTALFLYQASTNRETGLRALVGGDGGESLESSVDLSKLVSLRKLYKYGTNICRDISPIF